MVEVGEDDLLVLSVGGPAAIVPSIQVQMGEDLQVEVVQNQNQGQSLNHFPAPPRPVHVERVHQKGPGTT